MRNNNAAIVRKITGRTLLADKRRNFIVIAAISLTTFMIASVFSIGVSYYESMNMREKRMQGSVSHMAFAAPTEEQIEKIYTLDYVKAIGVGAYVAQTADFPKLDSLDIAYVDKTQWQEMFCPTYTNITGHYPKQGNEIMLSRYILGAMGIDNPVIGMEIPISYIVNGTDEVKTETFILSCIYTEYASVAGNKFAAIYSSHAFAEKAGNFTNDNISVNVIFKDAKRVGENIERLKQDLSFSENQKYVESPAFTENYGNTTTYIALLVIILFLMFMGYLLIYNVMYISVSKDVRFYGMLKTLGTTPRQIRRIVIGQILRLCMVGVPVGGMASAAVSLLVVPAILINSGIDTGAVVSFSPVIYIGAVLFAVITALIGAVTPAKKAANITPIEALKFTGEEIRKSSVHSSANGKPYKMAIRNIFRDRKRAAVVMLSLFLGITVFTTIMTVVTSMDIDYRVNAEYNYDFSLYNNNFDSHYLNDFYTNEVKEINGIIEVGAVTLGHTELIYSEMLDKYVDWLSKEHNRSKEDVIIDNVFYLEHGIKGIDQLTLKKLNKTLPIPIDTEAFERGEIALINIQQYEDMADCFADISALNLKRTSDGTPVQIAVGGIVSLTRGELSYSPMEILVSNNFIQQHYPESQMLYLDMNVENSYDEQIYNTLEKTIDPAVVKVVSRYAARQAMQDAKTIMFVLGGGISLILGFIGVFNFINVMSVGVMVRKREFATLESIGMGKKQMRSMLRNEGIGYAVISILCSLTVGNLIAYGLFLLYKNAEKSAQFTYPLIPVLVMCAVISLICFITPEVVYRSISKMTLVERLREAE